MYCVGLLKNEIKADDEFVCKKCKKVSKTSAKDNCDKMNDDDTPKKRTEFAGDDPDGGKKKSQTDMEISVSNECHRRKSSK